MDLDSKELSLICLELLDLSFEGLLDIQLVGSLMYDYSENSKELWNLMGFELHLFTRTHHLSWDYLGYYHHYF